MNFFPEIEAIAKWRLAGRLSIVSLTALSFLMQCGPALAEKVEQTIYAKAQRPPDTFLLGLFTVLNYIAGIAILATLVFSVIWFFQKRNDPGETDTVDSEAEAETAAATGEAKAADSAESKADENKSDETKAEETKSEEAKSEEAKSEEKKED